MKIMKPKEFVKKFKEETGYTLEYNNGKFSYGGSLYLRGTPIQSLPDNLTVEGYLDLRGTLIQSLPDNLTVGGIFDLEGTQIQSLPDNLTVGGYLDLTGTPITDTSMVNRKFNVDMVDKLWSNSKFIKVDGMFAEKVSHHGNVWEVKKISGTKTFFIVTDGNGKYAHGDTIQEAKKDLIYKISNRDKSEYENLTLDSELSFEEAIECYRVITGACSFGTKDFVENYLSEKKDKYTIREMIELTKGRYGNEIFKEFFKP